MEIEAIETDRAPLPGGHYAQATAFRDLIFVSGQLPLGPDRAPVADTFDEQVAATLKSLFAILEAAGSDRDHVLKVTAYIVGVEHWPAFNRVYAEHFGNARPARAVVPVPELHHGCLVELEAIAVRRATLG